MTNYDPNHESTRDAWQAVLTNLTERADQGLWGSRMIAVTIARNAGLTTKRAEDLIRSAIKHGYLEERTSPFGAGHTTQVRPGRGGLR